MKRRPISKTDTPRVCSGDIRRPRMLSPVRTITQPASVCNTRKCENAATTRPPHPAINWQRRTHSGRGLGPWPRHTQRREYADHTDRVAGLDGPWLNSIWGLAGEISGDDVPPDVGRRIRAHLPDARIEQGVEPGVEPGKNRPHDHQENLSGERFVDARERLAAAGLLGGRGSELGSGA